METERTGRRKKAARLALGLFLVFLFGVAAELFWQRNLLFLPKENTSLYSLPLSDAAVSGNGTLSGDSLRLLPGEEAELVFDLQGQYVHKLCYDFHAFGMFDADVEAERANLYGEYETVKIRDRNVSSFSTSVINLDGNTGKVTLRFTGSVMPLLPGEIAVTLAYQGEGLLVRDFSVDNRFSWNLLRMAFFWIFGGLLVLLITFREWVGAHVGAAFFVCAMVVGSLMILAMPAYRIGWDEETHFQKAWILSRYPAKDEWNPVIENAFQVGLLTWHDARPASREEKEGQESFFDYYYNTPESLVYVEYPPMSIAHVPGYFLQGMAIKAARKLDLSYSFIFRAGRFCNLFFYALLTGIAICLIPVGKRILAVLALMPTPLFSACTYSYDVYVNAGCFLVLAVVLREYLSPRKKMNLPLCFLALLAGGAGILSKAVYAPMLLLFLLIPVNEEKGKAAVRFFRVLVILAFFAEIASFVVPILQGASVSDPRGGETNSITQTAYVLGKPFSYSMVLIKTVWDRLGEFFGGHDELGTYGFLYTSSVVRFMLPVMLAVAMTDTYRGTASSSEGGTTPGEETEGCARVDGRLKFFLFVICGAAFVLIATSMYMAFTPVGGTGINGVQARYMIPFLPCLYLILNQDRIRNGIPQGNYTVAVLLAVLFLEAVGIWEKMVVPFVF